QAHSRSGGPFKPAFGLSGQVGKHSRPAVPLECHPERVRRKPNESKDPIPVCVTSRPVEEFSLTLGASPLKIGYAPFKPARGLRAKVGKYPRPAVPLECHPERVRRKPNESKDPIPVCVTSRPGEEFSLTLGADPL